MSELFSAADEAWHPGAATEEWSFSWWSDDVSLAGWTMYRIFASNRIWYCFGLVRQGEPLLHVAEFDISRRPDPMIAKAESLWAEYVCDAPFEQWSLGNETYAVELDDAEEGLGRAYGRAVPIASDLEWYADGPVNQTEHGYEQRGVVLGTIETERGPLEISEVRAHRTHRWSDGALAPFLATSHDRDRRDGTESGPRLAFRFPDGTVWDAVATAHGWVRRRPDGDHPTR